VCVGRTSKAYTVEQVVDDGDGGFVIEGEVNTAFRCPTNHFPSQATQMCLQIRTSFP
jgi:hypothetical protein